MTSEGEKGTVADLMSRFALTKEEILHARNEAPNPRALQKWKETLRDVSNFFIDGEYLARQQEHIDTLLLENDILKDEIKKLKNRMAQARFRGKIIPDDPEEFGDAVEAKADEKANDEV